MLHTFTHTRAIKLINPYIFVGSGWIHHGGYKVTERRRQTTTQTFQQTYLVSEAAGGLDLLATDYHVCTGRFTEQTAHCEEELQRNEDLERGEGVWINKSTEAEEKTQSMTDEQVWGYKRPKMKNGMERQKPENDSFSPTSGAHLINVTSFLSCYGNIPATIQQYSCNIPAIFLLHSSNVPTTL